MRAAFPGTCRVRLGGPTVRVEPQTPAVVCDAKGARLFGPNPQTVHALAPLGQSVAYSRAFRRRTPCTRWPREAAAKSWRLAFRRPRLARPSHLQTVRPAVQTPIRCARRGHDTKWRATRPRSRRLRPSTSTQARQDASGEQVQIPDQLYALACYDRYAGTLECKVRYRDYRDCRNHD
jgi:hypothetical protein